MSRASCLAKCRTFGSQIPDDPATLASSPLDRAGWASALSALPRATADHLTDIAAAAEKRTTGGEGCGPHSRGVFQHVGRPDGQTVSWRAAQARQTEGPRGLRIPHEQPRSSPSRSWTPRHSTGRRHGATAPPRTTGLQLFAQHNRTQCTWTCPLCLTPWLGPWTQRPHWSGLP